MSAASLRLAAGRLGAVLAFGVVPAALLVAFLALAAGDRFAFDFHQFWQGGRDVLAGRSPYPSRATLDAITSPEALGPEAIQRVFRFPYPAPAALAMVPFALLPWSVAAGVLTVMLVASVGGALWLLGVRDWRCYGLAFASPGTLGAIRLGTLTPLLLLALALVWRYRDRVGAPAAALAAAIVLKLFLWPFVVWLVLTRRRAAAVVAVAAAVLGTAAAWWVIGFDGLREYPQLLSRLSDGVEAKGFSLVALGIDLGAPEQTARRIALAAGGAVLAGGLVAARRRVDERVSFSLVLLAALLMTPIVWLHYFTLLALPIALAARRLSRLWFLPLALWVVPFQETHGDSWKVAVGLVVGAATVALAAAQPLRRRYSSTRPSAATRT